MRIASSKVPRFFFELLFTKVTFQKLLAVQYSDRNLLHTVSYLASIFSSPVGIYRKSYCTTSGVGGGISVSKMLKFYIKIFYVKGKALSSELSYMWSGLVS